MRLSCGTGGKSKLCMVLYHSFNIYDLGEQGRFKSYHMRGQAAMRGQIFVENVSPLDTMLLYWGLSTITIYSFQFMTPTKQYNASNKLNVSLGISKLMSAFSP